MSDQRSNIEGAGTRFGRYAVVERLGLGAMGAVYRAKDESLGREVAVKTIRGAMTEFQAEMFRARFENEARALAALSHPNVVNVFDVGVEDDTPYLVMELVQGRSLADRLEQQGPVDAESARVLGRQIAAALAAAHAQGIVHRDVKPGNVLEADDGTWKLADFGIAHVPDSSLTLTGQFLGSPAYAAPEAFERGDLGPASDVYGLGATLYEAVAGTPPYGKAGVMTVGAMAEGAAPRPVFDVCPGLPAPLAHAISSAIERDPARRCTAQQFITLVDGAATAVALPAPAAIPGSNRSTAILVIAALILIAGISIGAALSSSGKSAGSAPESGAPAAAPGSAVPRAPQPRPRPRERRLSKKDAEKNAHEWKKVREKLERGKYKGIDKHLRKILERDPTDEQARALYKQLTGYDWEDEGDEDWGDD